MDALSYNKLVNAILQKLGLVGSAAIIAVFLAFVSLQTAWAAAPPDIPTSAECTIKGKDGAPDRPGVAVSFLFFGSERCIPLGNDFLTNPIVQLALALVGFLAGGVILAVVGGVVFGGYLYMTARGNA